MSELEYLKIDAFTDGRSSGNPAGVVFLKDGVKLTEAEMQEIARQQKGIVNEVAFCTPLDKGFCALKYYSSECEVEFCGHATIACMYQLIKNDPALLQMDQIMIRTCKGDLPVMNDISNSDSVYIMAPAPEYIPYNLKRETIARNLNVPENIIVRDQEVSLVNGGLKTLIVPIRSLSDIVAINPDQMTLQQFCLNNNIDIILVYTSDVLNNQNNYRTRVFAPKFGYLEDPATGSGNAAFGYYLLKLNQWDGDSFAIEQGPSMEFPNVVKLKTMEIEESQRVLFGGNATVKYSKNVEL